VDIHGPADPHSHTVGRMTPLPVHAGAIDLPVLSHPPTMVTAGARVDKSPMGLVS